MKNIILIILTFFTLSLFGQTEQPDEFRAPTGVIKSVKGTNFKKSIKVIGGKNVTVYEQPNTDTYNTFSIVNDSVRIQKWKLDTATNVFVTSNLNDVYLDNLVNKPAVDSRVVLDMVDDSLKVEVWDIINNTLLSTYYIDNVGNHPETITTITNTIPNGNLIGTYTNEAGTPVTIKESVIGAVNNADGSVTITKEDGTTVTTTPFHNTNFVQTNDSLWIHTNLDGTKDTIKVPLPTVNTDTRLQLSVVNDSIKIEVVDVLTNTVTSTSYLDNMVNQPEIITTVTDTLVGGHLVANYNNEANTIRGIYESIIQVDSITNGYVITKEDGTKDTIKINPTGFYTLTDISDTLALNAVAASNCPALSIAKLDSCNVVYLFIFNCSMGIWYSIKTETREYKNTEYIVTQKYKTFLNNTGVANISNPAYIKQLNEAKMGCDHCPFPYPQDAINSALANNIQDVNINMSTDTFISNSGNLIDGGSNNIIKNLSIYNKGLIKLINSNVIDLSTFNAADRLNLDFQDIQFGNGTFNAAIWAVNPINPFKYINVKINNIESYGSNSYNSCGLFHAVRNLDYRLNNYKNTNAINLTRVFQLGFGNYKSAIANIELKNVSCFKVPITPSPYLTGNSVFYQDIGMDHGTVNYKCSNIYTEGNGLLTGLYLICVNDGYSQGVSDGSILSSKINAEFGNITSICNTTNFGTLTFNNPNAYDNKANVFELYTGSSSGSPIIDSTQINISCDNASTTGGQLIITGTGGVRTISNSTIYIRINKGISRDIVATISSLNLINSKLIIDGDFEASNKVISIHDNTLDATSSITLKGKFKTTSLTLEAIEIGNNSGTGVNNIIINGQIITGGGFSIDNPAGTPISVKVMPGCSSNVTTSANVTQLGTGIYVDPNFNN